jgi:hypothetical protein
MGLDLGYSGQVFLSLLSMLTTPDELVHESRGQPFDRVS